MTWMLLVGGMILGVVIVCAAVVEGFYAFQDWRARRSAHTFTRGWWKSREHLEQRVEYHGVIKFPVRK